MSVAVLRSLTSKICFQHPIICSHQYHCSLTFQQGSLSIYPYAKFSEAIFLNSDCQNSPKIPISVKSSWPEHLREASNLIMSPNCCKYFVNSRTPNRKNKRPATPANTATGIFAALIRLMKSELTEIKFEMQ